MTSDSKTVRLEFSGAPQIGLLLSGFQFAMSHIALRRGPTGGGGSSKLSMSDELDQVFFFLDSYSHKSSNTLHLIMFLRLSPDEFAVVRFPSCVSSSNTSLTKSDVQQVAFCVGDTDIPSIMNGVLQSGAPPPRVGLVRPFRGPGSNMLIWSSYWKNRGPTEVQIPLRITDSDMIRDARVKMKFIDTPPKKGIEIELDKASAVFAVQAILRPARSAKIASDSSRRIWMRIVQVEFNPSLQIQRSSTNHDEKDRYRLCMVVCAAVTQEGLGTIQTTDAECSTFYAIRDLQENSTTDMPKVRFIHSTRPTMELEHIARTLRESTQAETSVNIEQKGDDFESELALLSKNDSIRGDMTTVIEKLCSDYECRSHILYEGGLCSLDVLQKVCEDYSRSQSKASSIKAKLSVVLDAATTRMSIRFDDSVESNVSAMQYRIGRNYPEPGNEDAEDIKQALDMYIERQSKEHKNKTLAVLRDASHKNTLKKKKKKKRKLIHRSDTSGNSSSVSPSSKKGRKSAGTVVQF